MKLLSALALLAAIATASAQVWEQTCEFSAPVAELAPMFYVGADRGGEAVTQRGALRLTSKGDQAAFIAIGKTARNQYVQMDTWGDPAAWNGSKPTTVETQMRVAALASGAGVGAMVQVSNGWLTWTLHIGKDGILARGECAVPVDTSQWHVYRISMRKGQANGFVDGKPIPDACLHPSGVSRNALLLGDFSSAVAGVSEWNYVRWTNREAQPFAAREQVSDLVINKPFELSDLSVDMPAASGCNLVNIKGGRILLTYSGPVNPHGREPGTVRIYGRESGDGGKTWGEERELLMRPECQACGSSLLRAKNGRLWMVYMGFHASVWKDGNPVFPDCQSDLWAAFSDDEGETWQGDKRIWRGYTGATNGVIQTRSGAMIVPFSYDVTDPGRLVSACLISRDNGGTWEPGKPIDMGGQGDHGGALEPTVVELKDGRVLMFIRTTKGAFYRAFSSDDGMTWTEPERTSIESPSSPCYLKRLESGRIAIVWNNTMSTTKGRDSIHIALSDDEAQTWSKPVEIGNAQQLSYPFLLEVEPGRLLIMANHVQAGWQVITPIIVTVDEEALLAN